MHTVSKLLIGCGIALILGGIFYQFAGHALHLGRLPGDIVVERGHVRFYLPITTCILLSVIFTMISFVIKLLK